MRKEDPKDVTVNNTQGNLNQATNSDKAYGWCGKAQTLQSDRYVRSKILALSLSSWVTLDKLLTLSRLVSASVKTNNDTSSLSSLMRNFVNHEALAGPGDMPSHPESLMPSHIKAVIISIIVDSACLQGAHSLVGEKRQTSRDPIREQGIYG